MSAAVHRMAVTVTLAQSMALVGLTTMYGTVSLLGVTDNGDLLVLHSDPPKRVLLDPDGVIVTAPRG